MHAVVFADRAPEAKNAHVMGENRNSKGLKKRKNSDRNGQKSEKSKYNENKCSIWGRLGGKKVKNMIESAWSCFLKMCFPLRREALFWKKAMRKVSWNIKIMKVVSCSLHFWHKFTSMSVQHSFFAPRSALASVFWKSQNQPCGHFGSAGRNARGRWEEMRFEEG